jgi:hypothetical protein
MAPRPLVRMAIYGNARSVIWHVSIQTFAELVNSNLLFSAYIRSTASGSVARQARPNRVVLAQTPPL